MPYRRQYRRRRSYAPRRQSRSSRYLDTASKALAVAYSVKKLLNVEFRHHEAEVTINPSTSGLVSNLSLVAQGDASTQREGNSFRAKSLTLRGTDTANSSATSPTVVLISYSRIFNSKVRHLLHRMFSRHSMSIPTSILSISPNDSRSFAIGQRISRQYPLEEVTSHTNTTLNSIQSSNTMVPVEPRPNNGTVSYIISRFLTSLRTHLPVLFTIAYVSLITSILL